MPRPRGGDRSKRINHCVSCRNAVMPGQHAQMLRFTYLCQSCHGRGLRLVLEDSAAAGRKTVRLSHPAPPNPTSEGDEPLRNDKPAPPQKPGGQPLPTGTNCPHLGCP